MAGFVKDGHLTVGVHISVPVQEVVISGNLWFFKLPFGMSSTPSYAYLLQMQAPMFPAQVCETLSSALSCNIALLFDDPASSDVAIKAGDTTVHAHKTILAAQSPTFRAMFQVIRAYVSLCRSCKLLVMYSCLYVAGLAKCF